MFRKKLKEIAKIFSGTYQYEIGDGDLLYLQVKDFTSFHLSNGEIKPTVLKSNKNERYILQDNDLLFAAKGISNFCALYNKEQGEAIASSAFFIIRLMSLSVLPDYICWYINTPYIIRKLQAKAVGSATPSITKEILMDMDISIPTINVQYSIIKCSQMQEKEYSLQKEIAEKKKHLYDLLLIKATNTI